MPNNKFDILQQQGTLNPYPEDVMHPLFRDVEFFDPRDLVQGLIPHKRGPRRAHKLTPEVLQFIAQLRSAQPALGWQDLAQQVAQRFALVIHPRTIERGLLRQKKRQ
jgi:hypothetical protein